MSSGQTYLLIVTCSQRKRSDRELLPALERYDGVFFRILRKALREGHWSDTLDVLIISAKYGLLELDTVIENYDLRMTVTQAKQLQPVVTPLLIKRVTALTYTEIFLNVGKTYYEAIEGWSTALPHDTTVIHASGGIGQRAQQMRHWLIEKTASKKDS
jgi:hypothetical protein